MTAESRLKVVCITATTTHVLLVFYSRKRAGKISNKAGILRHFFPAKHSQIVLDSKLMTLLPKPLAAFSLFAAAQRRLQCVTLHPQHQFL